VDLVSNDNADANVVVGPTDSWTEQSEKVTSLVAEAVGEHKLDAIFCVAGGWAGGNAGSEGTLQFHILFVLCYFLFVCLRLFLIVLIGHFFAGFVNNCDMMWKQSVWTSTIAAELASKHLQPNGLLQLTGAAPALEGTSFMMGYGMAKAAVHQLTKSLGGKNTGLPTGTVTFAILPSVFDNCIAHNRFRIQCDVGYADEPQEHADGRFRDVDAT
jgi:dihydropteridine reductase